MPDTLQRVLSTNAHMELRSCVNAAGTGAKTAVLLMNHASDTAGDNTTHYPLLTTHYMLVATHYSLLTAHYSLLATH